MSKVLKAAATSRNMVRLSSGEGEAESSFETAITACGVGLFNICLVFASLSTAISVLFTTSSLSFILPTAQCDLNLSLMEKGYLNAMSFAGMVSSAILWGFLADTMGRKVVLVYALILDGIIVMFSATGQSLNQLLVLKFVDGFLICGPYAVVMSYVSEFHGQQHRPRVMMVVGMNFSAAAIILPVLAVAILPSQISLEINSFKINTWQVFLLATASVPFFGGIFNACFPESPKFLMSQGRNQDALECLRTIYAINYRKPKSEYPIKRLIDEDPEKTKEYIRISSAEYKETHNTIAHKFQHGKDRFVAGLRQLRPLCSSPYLSLSLLVYIMFFCILLGLNTIRLWLPQIFVTIEELRTKEFGNIDMCTILVQSHRNTSVFKSIRTTSACDLGHISISSYTDNIIVAVSSLFLYFLVSITINKLGNNLVLKIALCTGFLSGILLYFSNSHLLIVILASTYISTVCIAGSTIVTASVNLFPTQMRTMVIIIMMTFGRLGSLLGNILFPFFLSIGCLPPFLLMVTVLTVSFVLSLFLPNTHNVELK